MEKVKLTNEEFIKRAMNGERFRWNGGEFFYDNSKLNPFRLDDDGLKGYWNYLNGENEFEVVQPKPKTKIVKEWMISSNKNNNYWSIVDTLLTDEEVREYYGSGYKYKPTGREFEVEDENI